MALNCGISCQGLVKPPLMHSALLKVDTEVVDEADADADDEGIATVLVQTDTGSKRVAYVYRLPICMYV